MLATLAFLYTIFGICLVIYFLILEPIGRGLKKMEMDNRIMVENRRREAENRKREAAKKQEFDAKKFIETRVPACPKKPYADWTEEEFTRLRKRYLQLYKKSYFEEGKGADWERGMNHVNQILSKYDK